MVKFLPCIERAVCSCCSKRLGD